MKNNVMSLQVSTEMYWQLAKIAQLQGSTVTELLEEGIRVVVDRYHALLRPESEHKH